MTRSTAPSPKRVERNEERRMSHLSRLNDYALAGYLRGEHGEMLRREAQQVLYERGRDSVEASLSDFDDEEIAAHLRRRGWICFMKRIEENGEIS
jgi:hypothetical protein